MSVRLANGLHMPELGFGTFQASGQPLHQAVLKALDVGIQHIDTATIYRVGFACNLVTPSVSWSCEDVSVVGCIKHTGISQFQQCWTLLASAFSLCLSLFLLGIACRNTAGLGYAAGVWM